MEELQRIANKLKGHDPATLTPDVFTEEEWAIMQEHYNEQVVKVTNLESIQKWVNLTNYLPNGILSPDEKMEMIKLVMSRVPKDWKSRQ